MKLSSAIIAVALSSGHGFSPTRPGGQAMTSMRDTRIAASSSNEDEATADRMRAIMEQEAANPANMAAAAEKMKSMTPEDMTKLMKDMEGMMDEKSLRAMGMDPAVMRRSMQMMRDNPDMMKKTAELMQNLTPEQLMEQSRLAQQQIAAVSPVELEGKASEITDATIVDDKEDAKDTDLANFEADGGSMNPDVIACMFRTAELMSRPPSGGVTFKAFSTLPPIMLLSGDREQDLSAKELAECWASGSLGATRVDRAGFERVWKEVQEYFEDDIMEEARKTSTSKGWSPSSKAATPVAPSSTTAVTSSTPTTTVGENLSPEQMDLVNERVKNMSDDDVSAMLEQMSNMGPAEQARMKAMGVDPEMMQKASSMMKTNPMLRKAAQAMMSKMSPEQMMKASQQAQQQMAGMSKEEYEKAMERIDKMSKGN